MDIKLDKDQKVNKIVTNITEKLKEEIISLFHPKSIILFGSFGKGEISVYEKNGKIKFLSDCDVIIIPYRLTLIFNRKTCKFQQDFYKRTGLKVDICGATLSFCFYLPFLAKKILPTMATYDLKYSSRVIYGENYLERIPNFDQKDIPIWEGIKLLLNRAAEALGYFSLKNPNENMAFWTDKIVLACQDALLISSGVYHPSYQVRNETFQKMFPRYLGEISKDIIKNLLNLGVEATNRKINGIKYSGDPVKYWFEAREIWDGTFRYIIRKNFGIEFSDYVEFQEKYLKNEKLKECYFEILPFHVYQELVSMLKIIKLNDIKLFFNIIIRSRRLSFFFFRHLVYSLIPLIYFSLSEGYRVNRRYLNRVRELLSTFKKLKRGNSATGEYEYLKNELLRLWHYIH